VYAYRIDGKRIACKIALNPEAYDASIINLPWLEASGVYELFNCRIVFDLVIRKMILRVPGTPGFDGRKAGSGDLPIDFET
jgi:hypothetical protein